MYRKALTAMLFALSMMACPLSSYALSFYTNVDYPGVLLLEDGFEVGDSEAFEKHVAENDIDTIMLVSNGGNLMAAVQIGYMIRDKKLNTIVPQRGFCYSACTYAFMGGIERIIVEGSPFAMHRPYFNEKLFDKDEAGDYVDGYNDGVVAAVMVASYLMEMGLDPSVASLHLLNVQLAHFSPAQQEELNITNAKAKEPFVPKKAPLLPL